MNQELSDVQAGFRKGRGTRDQIANTHWIIEKAREFQKNICFIDHTKAFDCVDHNKLCKIIQEMGLLRESIPRQFDKKSGVPKEKRRVWDSQGGDGDLEFSRRRKGKMSFWFFFPLSAFFGLSHIKRFFPLSPELMITQQTSHFKLCPRDYITAMYPA